MSGQYIVEVLGADGSVQGWVASFRHGGVVANSREAATVYTDKEDALRRARGATDRQTRLVLVTGQVS